MMMMTPRSGGPQERFGGKGGPAGRASSRFSSRPTNSTSEAGVAGPATGPGSGGVAVARGGRDGDRPHPQAERRWRKQAYPGEVFPLPSVFVEPPPRRDLSRRVRQRVFRRRHEEERVKSGLGAMNFLCGFDGVEPVGPPSDAQRCTVDRMREAVVNRPPLEGAPNAEAAARALLGARAGYSSGSGEVMLAPYQAGAVSLVANALDGPMVEDVTSGATRLYLDEWEERMLRTDADYQEMLEKDGTFEPYIDSTLKSSIHLYLQFINDLKRRGLLRWTRAPKERVGVFLCDKENGKLRFTIYARRTNQRFRTPPGVALSSAEAFSDVECEPGQKVFISTTIVGNCVYKMRTSRNSARVSPFRRSLPALWELVSLMKRSLPLMT